MPNCDPDQKKRVDEQADLTIAQKVKALQERVRKMGAVSDGSDDKAFMDDAWGEDSSDTEG
ncbi:hypothetical protein CP157_04017 (plasmid) [Paracoccus marcusii]|jgi:hypothetical protein|nr:hypothetical protein CP157_04017 [Paracoccus marcusii]